MRAAVELPANSVGPHRRQCRDDLTDRPGVLVERPEVEAWLEPGRAPQGLGQDEVATERTENVLPGANRVGVADQRLLPLEGGAHHVGDEPVLTPVTAAD